MSEKKGSYQEVPSSPDYISYGLQATRNPPPSYEESQKHTYPMHPPPAYPAGSQFLGYSNTSNSRISTAPGVSYMTFCNNTPMGYHPNNPTVQSFHNVVHQQSIPFSNMTQQTNITQAIVFDSGARFKGKGAGSITVPPPPPGYLPTPAQMAALQGQTVILQKKKNPFF